MTLPRYLTPDTHYPANLATLGLWGGFIPGLNSVKRYRSNSKLRMDGANEFRPEIQL